MEDFDYQLVIKLWRKSLDEEAFLTTFETRLSEAFGDTARLDGYDTMPKDIVVFILTRDPRHTFRRAKAVLEAIGVLHAASAASRLVGGARFTSIWPLRTTRKFTLP